jgi:hypothetical protein
MPGRYHVSTDYSCPELHAEDTDKPRRAEFVLGTPAAVSLRLDGEAPNGWTQSVTLRASRNVKLHRYNLTGEYTSGWSTWSFDLVPRNEPYHLVIVRKPKVKPTDDKKEMRERERESSRQLVEIASQPIRFVDPQLHSLRAAISTDEASDTTYLSLTSFQDAFGKDRLAELVDPDPMFGIPAGPDQQR